METEFTYCVYCDGICIRKDMECSKCEIEDEYFNEISEEGRGIYEPQDWDS